MKCCDVTLGMLNRQLTFERATKTRVSGGGYDYTWSPIKTLWGKITPKIGTEKTHAGKLRATNFVKIIVRYTTALKESDIINYRGDDYEIRSIINTEEADLWIEILAEKGVIKGRA